MIAMQYSFSLPADYDMEIIDRRIRDKGPLLDGFPRLRFKAYLSARKQDDKAASTENLYAPFYLWDEAAGIDSFLSGPGFAAVSGDFGWPSVQTWIVWQADIAANPGDAKFATRDIRPIAPHCNLAALRENAMDDAKRAMAAGALATVAAFDPTEWRQLQFCLWPDVPGDQMTGETSQLYRVGHVSLPLA
ncbi:DUF4865 family protein [Thalassospira marina]|uniref:DUF4865 domain-containing protein n=1 Tax=Thalassospira marina TaxID=2048283 RepID=A0A2N3KTS2_9PROT|nr:DUF4865 family protein [Thalassospira marina]PKR53989.1 DUF4865 domain-containing protein [Thalassospira marina]